MERRSVVTALWAGISAEGRLAPDAIERTAAALAGFRGALEGEGVEAVKFVATAAVREAVNAEDFLAAAEAAIGVRPEVIDGEQEGRLAYAGATAGLDPADGPFLVADLGGGSTEFGFGRKIGRKNCESVHSCGVGSVRLTEQYIHHDPPLPEELHACLSVVESHLDDVVLAVPQVSETACFVGVAGTVATAAAVELGLAAYDVAKVHHFELSRAAAEDVFRTLATEDRSARLANPGMHPGRVDVIVAGMCVLVKIMRYFGFESCLVSESDLLDGLILELAAERSGSAGASR